MMQTRDAGLLHISGKPSAGVSLEQAEAAVRKELQGMGKFMMPILSCPT